MVWGVNYHWVNNNSNILYFEMIKLNLQPTEHEGLKVGVKADGRKYSVRTDRGRYFFPQEWINFISTLRQTKRMLYITLLQTGGRITEIVNIRPRNFDWERNTLTLTVTKIKATRKETTPKKRTFKVSEKFAKQIRKYIRNNNIENDDIIFPTNKFNAYQVFRRALNKSEIDDAWNFGLHNIRKSTGNWLKALGVPAEEICLRLGHDFNTYLKHYGSATIFNEQDRRDMLKILGEIY